MSADAEQVRAAEREFAEANARYKRGDLAGADAAYRRTLALVPGHWAVHFGLGNVLYDQRRLDEAIVSYREALRLKPDAVQACSNLGAALLARARAGDPDEAVIVLNEAVRLNPEYAGAYVHLGNALQALGRSDEAATAYRQAIRLRPESADAHCGLGNALQARGDVAGALASYRDAVRVKPDLPEAHNNLAAALKTQGHLAEALASYREALRLKPDYGNAAAQALHLMQELCIWDELTARTDALRRGITTAAPLAEGVPPFSMVVAETSAREQQLCARRWAETKRFARPREDAFAWSQRAQTAGRRRRIGYLSSDFHEHPVGYLMSSVYEACDPREFEIFAYSFGSIADSPMRRRLQAAFARFTDVRPLSHQAAANAIHADGVDILVDLNGLTANARSEILAFRPAPVQVQFLGYPGTMGTTLVDYVMADRVVIPETHAAFFDEQVVYMPDCYQPNDPKRAIGPAPTRAEAGLPESAFVFGSLNHPYKFTPAMFEVWMRILRAVPGSVLWLLESNRWAPDNLRREAEARGVTAGRLIFAAGQPQAAHLGRLALADLVLDTRPVNSHTTASDALWAGVPVLTCPGETFVSRVAASLLTTMGLRELVTDDSAAYERTAVGLARQADTLATLRAKVHVQREASPVFDAVRFARHLEAAYRAMWERYARGEAPASFRIAPTET